MNIGDRDPTPPLEEFLAAYAEDDNWWWRIACGHHQNLFDAALERIETVHALVSHARAISPGQRMTVYVADLEQALGLAAPGAVRPHKLGASE